MSVCVSASVSMSMFGDGKRNPPERSSQETALLQK